MRTIAGHCEGVAQTAVAKALTRTAAPPRRPAWTPGVYASQVIVDVRVDVTA